LAVQQFQWLVSLFKQTVYNRKNSFSPPLLWSSSSSWLLHDDLKVRGIVYKAQQRPFYKQLLCCNEWNKAYHSCPAIPSLCFCIKGTCFPVRSHNTVQVMQLLQFVNKLSQLCVDTGSSSDGRALSRWIYIWFPVGSQKYRRMINVLYFIYGFITRFD
jgi:hypothetical protein